MNNKKKLVKENWKSALLTENASIQDAMLNIEKTSLKISIIVDEENKLIGTVSDGDIRRGLLDGLSLTSNINKIINKNPLFVKSNLSNEEVTKLMKSTSLFQIPIVDKNLRVVGMHLLNENSETKIKENIVLIMAGGMGLRMMPHTSNTPKPMLKVHGKPILEHIIVKAKAQGFYNFCISVHYLASQIKDYFEDGRKLGVKISYIEEKEPLGTAGAIALMHPQPTDSFLVTNGDLISSIQFDNLLSYHKENKASASMSVFLYKFENPFGIVKTNGILVDGFEEKPVSKHNINAGVYVFEPEVIKFLKKYQKYDIPTLFNLLKEKNKRIIAYFVHENWLDIGKPEDLDKINKQLGT